MRRLAQFLLVLSLSGCGSAQTGASSGALGDSSGGDPTPVSPGNLPTTGSASYSGAMTLNLPPAPGSPKSGYTGNLGLSADFAATSNQVRGLASDFRSPAGSPVQGRIFVTDGTIERTGNVAVDYSFDARMSGTLSGGGLDTLLVTGQLSGDFFGADQSAISGVAFGDVTATHGVDVFDGSFAVSKN